MHELTQIRHAQVGNLITYSSIEYMESPDCEKLEDCREGTPFSWELCVSRKFLLPFPALLRLKGNLVHDYIPAAVDFTAVTAKTHQGWRRGWLGHFESF